MSGFEMGFKTKIRGAKADVVITTADDQPFSTGAGWRETVLRQPGVVGATPYRRGRGFMIRGRGSACGKCVLRGIDPDTARSVLDLGRTLREGSGDVWSTPSRVATTRLPARPESRQPATTSHRLRGQRAPPSRGRWRVLPSILLGEELSRAPCAVFRRQPRRRGMSPVQDGPSGPCPASRVFRAPDTSTAGCTSMTPSGLHGAGHGAEVPGEPVSHRH